MNIPKSWQKKTKKQKKKERERGWNIISENNKASIHKVPKIKQARNILINLLLWKVDMLSLKIMSGSLRIKSRRSKSIKKTSKATKRIQNIMDIETPSLKRRPNQFTPIWHRRNREEIGMESWKRMTPKEEPFLPTQTVSLLRKWTGNYWREEAMNRLVFPQKN